MSPATNTRLDSNEFTWVLHPSTRVSRLQGPAKRPGGREAPPTQLFSLLPLQARHVERPEQEDEQGLAWGGLAWPELPAGPLGVASEAPVAAHCLPGLSCRDGLRRLAAPLVPPPSIVNSANEPLGPSERRCTFHCPSLCSSFGAKFSEGRGRSFLCVCVRGRYVCVCLLPCACAYSDGKKLFSFSLFLTRRCEDHRGEALVF